jgi:hypothetical protein
MLEILIPGKEFYDEETGNFINDGGTRLVLEHSLVSLSKWESRFMKPFLTEDKKTAEETLYYIECMSLDENFDRKCLKHITRDALAKVNEYIECPMTASSVRSVSGKTSREIVTSELIYYWMVALNIPSEYQHWHLNRLLMLIRICNVKNQPPRKMSRSQILKRNRELNAARRRQYNTRG